MPEVYRGRKSRGRKSGRKSPRKYSKGRKSGRKSPRHSRGRNRFRGVTYRGDAGVSPEELSDLQTPVPHLEDEFAERLGPNTDDVLNAEAVLEERRNTLLRNIQDDQEELAELKNFMDNHMDNPLMYKPLTEKQKREIAKLGYIGLGEPNQPKRNRSKMSGRASSSNKPAPQ